MARKHGKKASVQPRTPRKERTPSESLPNPERTLEQLKEQLEESQTAITRETTKHTNLKESVARLEQRLKDITQTLDTYAKAFENLQKEKADREEYFNTKSRMIEAAIGDKKDKIEEQINEVDKEIQDKEAEVVKLEGEHNEAKGAYEAAKEKAEKKQKEYEFVKEYQKNVDTKLKELKRLNQEIEREEEQANTELMYVLMKEYESILDEVKLKSEEMFEKELIEAWQDLYESNEHLMEKKEKLGEANLTLEEAKEALETLMKNRRVSIIEGITEGELVH